MQKRRQPLPKGWYRSKEAVFVFVIAALLVTALAAGLVWLIVRFPRAALITAGSLAAVAAGGYAVSRIAAALKWKKDMKKLRELQQILSQKKDGL